MGYHRSTHFNKWSVGWTQRTSTSLLLLNFLKNSTTVFSRYCGYSSSQTENLHKSTRSDLFQGRRAGPTALLLCILCLWSTTGCHGSVSDWLSRPVPVDPLRICEHTLSDLTQLKYLYLPISLSYYSASTTLGFWSFHCLTPTCNSSMWTSSQE